VALGAQVLVNGKAGVTGDELERELFVLRKAVEAEKDAKLPADKASDFYTCSLSNKTIIYKVCIGRAQCNWHGERDGSLCGNGLFLCSPLRAAMQKPATQ